MIPHVKQCKRKNIVNLKKEKYDIYHRTKNNINKTRQRVNYIDTTRKDDDMIDNFTIVLINDQIIYFDDRSITLSLVSLLSSNSNQQSTFVIFETSR